jgi:hypothetical protein
MSSSAPSGRRVFATAVAAHADAIVTFNVKDFAADHLKERLQIEVIHPDDFIMDLIDLNENAPWLLSVSYAPGKGIRLGQWTKSSNGFRHPALCKRRCG